MFVSTVLSVLSFSAVAQVAFREPVLRNKYQTSFASKGIATVQFEKFDNELLATERENKSPQESFGPYKFGHAIETKISLKEGKWEHFPRAEVWRLKIVSPSALSLNAVFSKFKLSGDGELYVTVGFPATGVSETLGPFTELNNKENGQFLTVPLKGNQMLLEYFTESRAIPEIQISKIVHGYRGFKSGDDDDNSRSCNINVACSAANPYKNQVKSVGMLLLDDGTGYCSGSMINNLANNGRQLFLTAYHCVGDGSGLTNNAVLFNFQASVCNGTHAVTHTNAAHGVKWLLGYETSDFALLEISERIPSKYDVYLSGWDASPLPFQPRSPFIIHHPSASIKKITFAFGNSTGACWGGEFCTRNNATHWDINRYVKGTTEPGSSGSPLFDSVNKRIVGQLHGGPASCSLPNGNDYYGKLALSFVGNTQNNAAARLTRLRTALDPRRTGKLFQNGRKLYQ